MILIKTNQNSIHSQISSESGIYILFIFLRRKVTIPIGSLGDIDFQEGYYLYIGSALNSGGLKGRINRHLKKEKKNFLAYRLPT